MRCKASSSTPARRMDRQERNKEMIEMISRDEELHTYFACLMFRHLVNKSSQDKIYNINNTRLSRTPSVSSASSSLKMKLFVVASTLIFLSNSLRRRSVNRMRGQ